MHRSGTSVITRGLKAVGVYLGESLLGPGPDNPKGYWEHKDIFELNEQVMAALDHPWWNRHPIARETLESRKLDELKERATSLLSDLYGARQLWGFKDPRTIRLFPFWRDVLRRLGPSVSIVLAIRPPMSAVRSLVSRDGMPVAEAEELWAAYMLPWLPDIAKYPVLVVDYDRLVRAPLRELRRVGKHLGVRVNPTDPEITEYTRSFVDRDLRHHVQPVGETSGSDQHSTLADEVYAALLKLTRSGASWRRCLELAHRYQLERAGPPRSAEPTATSAANRSPPAGRGAATRDGSGGRPPGDRPAARQDRRAPGSPTTRGRSGTGGRSR
jgi:hypothetical protein